MEINNGITDRERNEVIAAITELFNNADKKIENATDRDEYVYAVGLKWGIEKALSYLKERWRM